LGGWHSLQLRHLRLAEALWSAARRDPVLERPAGDFRASPLPSVRSARFVVLVSNRGVQFDESVGWTGQNGYRAGIAAPFFPLDPATGNPLPLIELPLMFMDANLSDGADGFAVFSEMFTHLTKIGGVLSLLFHPGTFANPEKPALTGLYARVLQHLRENGARNYLPRDIVRIAGDLRSGLLLPTEMMAGRLGR
jgi:hypothetical protein